MNPNDLPIANPSGTPPTGIQKVSLNSFFPGLNSKKSNSVAPPAPISLPPMTESKSNLLEGLSETETLVQELANGKNNYDIGLRQEVLSNRPLINSTSLILNYLNVNDQFVVYSHQNQYRIVEYETTHYTQLENYFDDVEYCCLGTIDTQLLAVLHKDSTVSIMNIKVNEEKPELEVIRQYIFPKSENCSIIWNPYDAYMLLYHQDNKYIIINILETNSKDFSTDMLNDEITVSNNNNNNILVLSSEIYSESVQSVVFISKNMFLIQTLKSILLIQINKKENNSMIILSNYKTTNNYESITGCEINGKYYCLSYEQANNRISLLLLDSNNTFQPIQDLIFTGLPMRLFNSKLVFIPHLNMILLSGSNYKGIFTIGMNDSIGMESITELKIVDPPSSVGAIFNNKKNSLSLIIEYDNMISVSDIEMNKILLHSHEIKPIILFNRPSELIKINNISPTKSNNSSPPQMPMNNNNKPKSILNILLPQTANNNNNNNNNSGKSTPTKNITPISLNTLAASMKIPNNNNTTSSSSPSLLGIKQPLYQSPPLQPPPSSQQQSSSSYQMKKSLQDLLPPSNVSFPVTKNDTMSLLFGNNLDEKDKDSEPHTPSPKGNDNNSNSYQKLSNKKRKKKEIKQQPPSSSSSSQQQINSIEGIPINDLNKIISNILDTKVNKLLKKIENSQIESQKKDQATISTVIDTFNMKMDSMKKQIDSIPVTIVTKINSCFQQLTKDIARLIASNMNQMSKDLNKTILNGMKGTSQITASCEQYEQIMNEQIEFYFNEQLIPAFNIQMQTMINDLTNKISSNTSMQIEQMIQLQSTINQSMQNYMSQTVSPSTGIVTPIPSPIQMQVSQRIPPEVLLQREQYDDAFKEMIQRPDNEEVMIKLCRDLNPSKVVRNLSPQIILSVIQVFGNSLDNECALRLNWMKTLLLLIHPSDFPDLYKQMKKKISPNLRKLAHSTEDNDFIIEAQVILRLLE